jgi:KaiC/GvpD/RAD55 family RecA-like ATPase
MSEIKYIKHFSTGVDELDKCLQDGICSDELVEICGASGSGKTYFCIKLISLALLKEESNIAVLYIDTSNYINNENISSVLKVSFNTIIVI